MKHVIFIFLLLVSTTFAQSANHFLAPDTSVLAANTNNDPKLSRAVELNNQAVQFCLENRPAEAVPLLRKALEIDPNSTISRRNLGIAFYNLKNYEKAIEIFEEIRARKAVPDVKTLVILGESLFAVGKNAESLEVLRKALEIEPDNAIALYNYGSVLQELKNYTEALKQYDRALDLQPDLTKALNNRGMTHFLLGDHQKALADLQKAFRLDETCAEYNNNLGVVFAHSGKKKLAHKYFLEAVRLRPDFSSAHFNLALSFQALGKRDEVFRHLRRLKELDENLAEILRKEMSKQFVVNAGENAN